MRSAKDKIEGLTPRHDLDSCLIQQLEGQVGSLYKNLSNLTRDILYLEEEEEDLLDKEATLCKAVFDLSVWIKRLLQDRLSNL